VLIIIERQYGKAPEEVFAAAGGTWYDELLRAAGGVNALKGSTPAYPMLSPESLVYLQPDIIIEVVPGAEERGLDAHAIIADWESFDMLEAVAGGRVRVLTGRYAAVPGPRFILLLEEFRGIIKRDGRSRPLNSCDPSVH
jgi:ABC-type Fe3+-hydroxamate transport system substrate-binding protein